MATTLVQPEQIDLDAIRAEIGDKHYVHFQSAHGGASKIWFIQHGLGKKASVNYYDTMGRGMQPTERDATDNEIYAEFTYETNGIAVCN